MAVKLSNTSGTVATISTLDPGDIGINLSDGKMFVTDGITVYEIGANLSGNSTIGGNITVGNSTVNTFITSSNLTTTDILAETLEITDIAIINTNSITVGNSSVNTIITSLSINTANITIQNNSTYGLLTHSASGNSIVSQANIKLTANGSSLFTIGTESTSVGGSSPALVINTGDTTGSGTTGNITIAPGKGVRFTSGFSTIRGGEQTNTSSGAAGSVRIFGGNHSGGGDGGSLIVGGSITITGGSITNASATSTTKTPGSITINGGYSINTSGLSAPSITIGTVNPHSKIEIGSAASGNTILYANGSLGSAGQVLTSNGSTAYWSGFNTGPAFSAYPDSAVTQTITSGSQQKVLFQLEEYDTNSNFASSRFTPTVAGYYQLNAVVRMSGTMGTGESMLVIWKNGSEHKRGWNASGTEVGASFFAMGVSTMFYANGTGDYFEVYIQQSSGSSKDITVAGGNITWFNGCMMRGA
jgi:hypothetical protein